MRITFKLKFLVILLFITQLAQSQICTVFNGVEFGEPLIKVKERVSAISENIIIIKVNNPSFPLSKNKEEHLIASIVKLKNGTIERVIFTFSDDKLSFIQAIGNVVNSIASESKHEAKTYLNYQVYTSDLLYINIKSDNAWILTLESLHPNLFTWNNPYLNSNVEINYNPSAKIPSFIKMEENLEVLLPLLKENSDFIKIENLEATNSMVKTQVNCYGIEYAGFPRKFEVRFENNKLKKVWILTGKEEENRIREKLTIEYGNSIFENDNWVVFNNWTVLLRKDKPEVLLITEELGLKYKKQYSE